MGKPAEPADRTSDEPVLIPASAHRQRAESAQPLPDKHRWPLFVFVLDLPRLLVHEVRATQAQVHPRMVAQVDHSPWGINGVAAPAPDVPLTQQIDGNNDGLTLMSSSVRHLLTPKKADW